MSIENDSPVYERLIRRRGEGKYLWHRILFGILCFVWVSMWFVIAVRFMINAPMIAFALLSTVLLVVLGIKYLGVEYEYSFVSGDFSLAKIYGKSRRKEMLSVELSRALLVAPYEEEYVKRMEELHPDETVTAISSKNAEDVWMFLYDEDGEKHVLVLLEMDDRAYGQFRRYCPRATVKRNPPTKD